MLPCNDIYEGKLIYCLQCRIMLINLDMDVCKDGKLRQIFRVEIAMILTMSENY